MSNECEEGTVDRLDEAPQIDLCLAAGYLQGLADRKCDLSDWDRQMLREISKWIQWRDGQPAPIPSR